MPPKRSVVEPIGTRSKTKRQKKTTASHDITVLSPNQTSDCQPQPSVSDVAPELSQQSVDNIVDAVMNAMQQRGLVPNSSTHSTEIHTARNNSVEQVSRIFTGNSTLPAGNDSSIVSANVCNETFQPVQTSMAHNVSISDTHSTNGTRLFNQPGTAALNTVHSYNLSPSALISDKIKQAIWKKEFIELSDLLKTQPEDVTIKLNSQNELIMVPKVNAKNLTINSWLSAFTIYMDIYAQAFPDELSSLLTYMNIIRDLERGYGQAAFNYYDRSFRAHRQSQPLLWGTLHTELWIRATSLSRTQGVNSVSNNSTNSKRYCYDFNKPKGCSKRFCQYSHICSVCKKNHPSFRCFLKPQAQNNIKAASQRPLPNTLEVPNTPKQHSFRNNTNKN